MSTFEVEDDSTDNFANPLAKGRNGGNGGADSPPSRRTYDIGEGGSPNSNGGSPAGEDWMRTDFSPSAAAAGPASPRQRRKRFGSQLNLESPSSTVASPTGTDPGESHH